MRLLDYSNESYVNAYLSLTTEDWNALNKANIEFQPHMNDCCVVENHN